MDDRNGGLKRAFASSAPTHLDPNCMVLSSGRWDRPDLEELLNEGDLELVPKAQRLWDGVWSLAGMAEGEGVGDASLSDGTAIWWAATNLGDFNADTNDDNEAPMSLRAMPTPQVADEALRDWLNFFGGHRSVSDAADEESR
eukprot:6196777-Pleurochrysis_carterae.AAC.1